MTELQQFAEFISHYGWLAVAILIVAAWQLEFFYSRRAFQREVARGDKLEVQRDAAIKLAQDLTDIMEGSRRGEFRRR